MSIIQFKEVNCKNCYKCIRGCPVKAISFKNDHAQVIEDGCVLCGKCLQECPQNAKTVKNDVGKVKGFINADLRVYASVAPSFAPAFGIKNEKQLYGIFRKLGFTDVQETAIGAARVSMEYEELLEEKQMKNIITTACPTIVSLVEKHYPELTEQLAPVVSPMIAHAKMIKSIYGSKVKVVFIGPCLAKKREGVDFEKDDLVDAVITFEELESWLEDEKLSIDSIGEIEPDSLECNFKARCYPAPGGIIQSLDETKNFNYKFAAFDGIDRCMNILDQIRTNKISNYFIEMNSCMGGCLGGPCMNSCGQVFLEMKDKLSDYIDQSSNKSKAYVDSGINISLKRGFSDKSDKYLIPDEKTIAKILSKTGKFSKEQELNCGGCGYTTCREKAIAVYNGKAEPHMCLPYMRERAESMSNVIIHSTPNAIFALNEELNIQEVNYSARKMFKLETAELYNKSIFDILDCLDIYKVSESKKDILDSKYYYRKYRVTVEQSILYLKDYDMIIIVMKDITKEEKQQENIHKVRIETAEIAQKVIDKQMRVVQEIASLLGETTAETKVALTKLKNSILSEMGE